MTQATHSVYLSAQKSLSGFGINPAANILVGVSGGVDSMVLLHILWSLKYKVTAAHVNFNLRGEASDADALLVRHWCLEHDITHYELSQDTTSYAAEHNLGIQLAARDIRYNWWEELLRQHTFDFIATAHHFDDNIETLFMNLLRGTGIKGLTGIPPKRDQYIRPLIDVSRREIESYADQFDVPYRTDQSNETDYYQRNKIRHHLIPLLIEMYPGLYAGMRHTLHRTQLEWNIWKETYEAWTSTSVIPERNGYFINGKSDTLAFQLRWLEAKGIPWNLAYDYLTAPKPTSGVPLNYDTWHLSRTDTGFFLETTTPSIQVQLYQTGQYTIGEFEFVIERVTIDQFQPGKDPYMEYINEDVVRWPLELRSVEPGDRFQPYGMQGKTKKLQDLMVDHKIEIYEKARQLVLTNDQHILWVVGLRLDERARVDFSASHIYRISYRPADHR